MAQGFNPGKNDPIPRKSPRPTNPPDTRNPYAEEITNPEWGINQTGKEKILLLTFAAFRLCEK
jgi:hypothetical protein